MLTPDRGEGSPTSPCDVKRLFSQGYNWSPRGVGRGSLGQRFPGVELSWAQHSAVPARAEEPSPLSRGSQTRVYILRWTEQMPLGLEECWNPRTADRCLRRRLPTCWTSRQLPSSLQG